MKKALFFVIFSIVIMVALLLSAFLYIDLSGHKYYQYSIFELGISSGSVFIDRYVTEEKIIYKGVSEYSEHIGFSSVNQKLFLNKKTKTPLKYEEKAIGENDSVRLILLVQEGETADYLFLDKPIYFSIRGFETGDNTMVFSPENIMLYLPIMGKYNYWKKGTQFFEAEIPVELPMPPMRDKISISYIADEYITIMGAKTEAESYRISSGSIPEAKVYMAKYSHRLLKLEVPKKKLEFVLENFVDTPWKRFAGRMKSLREAVDEVRSRRKAVSEEEAGAFRKEIFLENDGVILQGWLYSPAEPRPSYPLVVMVQDDGAMTSGENSMMESIALGLAEDGRVVLIFKDTGQRVASGRHTASNDADCISNLKAAVRFLNERFSGEVESFTLIAYKGGGYIALKVAHEMSEVTSCVLLGIPSSFVQRIATGEASPDDIQSMLSLFGLGPFDDSYMRKVSVELLRHRGSSTTDPGNAFFRDGIKLPADDFAAFLERDPYFLIEKSEKPILFIYGLNDLDYNQKSIDRLTRKVSSDTTVRMASFRELGPYMGDLSVKNGRVIFGLNDDVRKLLLNWTRKGSSPEVLPRNSSS